MGTLGVLLGFFLAKLLSIAGIGGFVSGLIVRRWITAGAIGVGLGVLDTLVLASLKYTGVAPLSWIMAIFVAVLMATLGWLLRGRKLHAQA